MSLLARCEVDHAVVRFSLIILLGQSFLRREKLVKPNGNTDRLIHR